MWNRLLAPVLRLLCCSLIALHVQALSTANVSNNRLVFSEQTLSTTHTLYGYFVNTTLEYDRCTFSTFATAFIDNDGSAESQLVENVTLIYSRCTFHTTNAVGIQRVIFKGILIRFIDCVLSGVGPSSLPTILINITKIQVGGLYADNEIQNSELRIEMNDTQVVNGDGPILFVQQQGTMFLRNVSFVAHNVTLETYWEIVNGDAAGVSVELYNVSMASARIVAVGGYGFSDIRIYAENSTFRETYETILKIRAGNRQSYHFHNCNLTLLSERFGDQGRIDANTFFYIEEIDDQGCDLTAAKYLRCSDWQFGASTCTYRGIAGYPCTGYSALTCGGPKCEPSNRVGTIVGAMVLLHNDRYGAPAANVEVLNVSAWLGCSLQRMRLMLSEEDANQNRGVGARVIIVPCNASLCTFDTVLSGSCGGCPIGLAVDVSNVRGDGVWYDVQPALLIDGNVLTLMVRNEAAVVAAPYPGGGGAPAMELELTCAGACLAPCASRDDINITLSGEIRFHIEGGVDPIGSLMTIQNSRNVRVTIGLPGDDATSTNVVGLPPIRFADGARGAQSMHCANSNIEMSSAFVVVLPSVSPVHLDVRFINCNIHVHAEARLLNGLIGWTSIADFASLQLRLVSSTIVVVLQRPEDASTGRAFSLLYVASGAVIVWNHTISIDVHASSVAIRPADGLSLISPSALFWVHNTSSNARLDPVAYRYDAGSRGMQLSIVVANSYVSCRASPIVLWTTPAHVHRCYLRFGSVVSLANVTFAIPPLDGEPLRVLRWAAVWALPYLAHATLPSPYLTLTVVNVTMKAFGECVPGIRFGAYLLDLADSSLHSFHADVEDFLVDVPTDCAIATLDKNMRVFNWQRSNVTDAVFRMSRVMQFSSMRWMLHMDPPPPAAGIVGISMMHVSPPSFIRRSSIAAANQPFVRVPLPGNIRLVHRVLWVEEESSPSSAWQFDRVNVSATCVANAIVNLSSSRDVHVSFNHLRTTYEQLVWVKDPSRVSISIMSCDIRPANGRGGMDFVWASNASEVRVLHGCNVPSDDVFFVSYAGPLEKTTSCDAFNSTDALCAHVASFSTSHPMTDSVSQTPTSSLTFSQSSNGSASHTRLKSLTMSFPSHSQAVTVTATPTRSATNTSSHATASTSLSSTPRLAYTPADVFSHITSECPDMEASDDRSNIKIPVAWVQRYPISIVLNVTRAAGRAFFQNGGTAVAFAPLDVIVDIGPSAVLNSDSQTVRVTVGPIGYNPFELRTFALVVGPDPFVVHPSVVTVSVGVEITPLDTTMPPSVSSAISSTTSAVSLLTLNPVASGTQSRVNMLLSLKVCSYAAENDDYSLMGFGIGDRESDAYFYRGAVVGNVALVVGIAVVVLIGIGGVAVVSSKDAATCCANLLTAMHMPGLLMAPVVLLLQPTASASVALFLIGDGTVADVTLALFGIVSCGSAVAYVSVSLVVNRSLLAVQKRAKVERAVPASQWDVLDASWHASAARRWVVSDFHWVPQGSRAEVGNVWKKRHLQLFADYSLMQYATFSLLCDAVVAIVNGLAVSGVREVCTFQLVLMTVIYAAQTATLVLMTPVLSRVTMSALCMTNGCSACCSLLVLIAVASPSQAVTTVCLDASNFVATVVSLLGTLQALPMFVEGLFSLPSILRQVQRAKDGNNETSQKHQDEPKGAAITLSSLSAPETASDEGALEYVRTDDTEAPVSDHRHDGETEEEPENEVPAAKAVPVPTEHIFSSQMTSHVSTMLHETDENTAAILHADRPHHRSFLDEYAAVKEDVLHIEL